MENFTFIWHFFISSIFILTHLPLLILRVHDQILLQVYASIDSDKQFLLSVMKIEGKVTKCKKMGHKTNDFPISNYFLYSWYLMGILNVESLFGFKFCVLIYVNMKLIKLVWQWKIWIIISLWSDIRAVHTFNKSAFVFERLTLVWGHWLWCNKTWISLILLIMSKYLNVLRIFTTVSIFLPLRLFETFIEFLNLLFFLCILVVYFSSNCFLIIVLKHC